MDVTVALVLNMRIIARFEKSDEARFVSHLDVQRVFQRAMHRAAFPVAYSQGFNPHPLVAFATALAVGYTSSGEWLDVKLSDSLKPEKFVSELNNVLPSGFTVLEAREVEDNRKALTALMHAASYDVTLSCQVDEQAVNELMNDAIIVLKQGKAGSKQVDIRPDVFAYSLLDNKIKLIGRLDASGSLNIELLINALERKLQYPLVYRVHRNSIIYKITDAEQKVEGL